MNGKTLYEARCLVCHGSLGEGDYAPISNPAIDPDKTLISHSTAPSVLLSLEAYIAAYMAPGALSKRCGGQCAADVAAYIRTLPSAVTGKTQYDSSTHACATCHGANGVGGLSGIDIPTSYLTDLVNGGGYLTVQDLSAKIFTSMPQTKTVYKTKTLNTKFGSCDQACSDAIAKYIWSTF